MKNLVDCASIPCRLPADEARAVDEIVKKLPQGLSYQRKSLAVEYQFEPGERAEVSILTSAEVDKSKEVVLPEGMDLDSYRKSGVVLWNHKVDQPVASCAWIKLHQGNIRAKTVYPEKPDDYQGHWFTDQIWAMTKSMPPILKCKSVGFLPLTPLREPTTEELEQHPEWAGSGVWEETKLLEYSCVFTGCLDSALVECINTKSLDPSKLEAMGIQIPKIEKKEEIINKLAKYTADDCVSRKIKVLHDSGEAKGKSDDQIIAMAYAHCKAKKQKKKVDPNVIIQKVIANLDTEKIVQKAVQLYQNRFKV